MAGRGRGRGRESSKNERDKRIPRTIDELAKYLHSLNEKNLDVYGTEFSSMVCGYADDETKVAEVVQLVFETTIASQEYSVLGSCVCDIIHKGSTDTGSKFLRKLLNNFQFEVKRSKEIRSKSIEHWLGIFAFLCEIYNKIRINREPIEVVGKSILQIIDMMLNDSDTIDDEVDTICTKLKVCGKSLEQQDCGKIENILGLLRQEVIRGKCSHRRRCLIMEVIELKQLGWNDKSGYVDRFYTDALADAVVEDESDCS
jgi:effector-binding domain-containing protein